jgi:biopolymer transport protein ExbD
MLRKRKNKHPLPDSNVNVTSLMDIMTTLLFFILMVLTFNKLTIIDAFAPQSGAASDDKKKVFTLQIAFPQEGKVEIQLGPLEELKMVNESRLLSFLDSQYKGSKSKGYRKTIVQKDPRKMKELLHAALIDIKKAFPHEHRVTLALSDKVVYQDMIDVMEALKQLPQGRPMELKNLIGKTEWTTVLFPQVVLVEM